MYNTGSERVMEISPVNDEKRFTVNCKLYIPESSCSRRLDILIIYTIIFTVNGATIVYRKPVFTVGVNSKLVYSVLP
jgi:hypothetical protein